MTCRSTIIFSLKNKLTTAFYTSPATVVKLKILRKGKQNLKSWNHNTKHKIAYIREKYLYNKHQILN